MAIIRPGVGGKSLGGLLWSVAELPILSLVKQPSLGGIAPFGKHYLLIGLLGTREKRPPNRLYQYPEEQGRVCSNS